MSKIISTSACLLVLVTAVLAQAPINTIASVHATEITFPPAPLITAEGGWRLVKYVKGPTVIKNDAALGYPIIISAPEYYVAQVTVSDSLPASTERKAETGECFGLHKFIWSGQGNEPLPPSTGGQGRLTGTMDLYSWIHLIQGDGGAGYATAVKVKCPELDVDEEMHDGLLKGTRKKKLFSFGFAWRNGSVLFDVDQAVSTGFYPGAPSPLELFGGAKSNINSCHVIQSTGATIEAWADGSVFLGAQAQAFSHGWSTYNLNLTD